MSDPIRFYPGGIGFDAVQGHLNNPSGCNLRQLEVRLGREVNGSFTDGSGESRVRLLLHTRYVQGRGYFEVRGAACESDSVCTEGQSAAESTEGRALRIPEGQSITAVYLANFGTDRLPDVMVTLSNGRALVFETEPPQQR